MANEVTIVTAVHNIKSNKGSRTAGVDKIKMDKYLQMPKDELILLIQSSFRNYRPKPARREYIEKSNGKKRPLGIPTVLDRIIQECVRIIIEPICEARFYPQSYGFRPYRAQKHAIRGIINVINAGCKSPDQPVWAIEGDIKGCFDNINHRLLLQKLWRIGIHDKRVLKIISQMLKAGYMENDLFHATELGTPQGGILSPLLSNVYLNDFDWYVGRMYMEPHRQCKHKGNDTRRLKWAGVTPKYNYRYADDWVILTSTEKEALRLKRVLAKYFRNRMKLELSQEKTYVTDLRTNGIHFLGFVVKAERKRKTPDPATWTKHLVGKPLPDMERLGKKIKKLLEEVHRIELCQKVNVQAAQIQYVNSVIMGMAQYLQTSICSHAYHAIDRRVNNAALTVWKKLYPKRYNSMQVPLKVLCNLPDRHKGYDSKTFAVWVEGKWFGITYAFITHGGNRHQEIFVKHLSMQDVRDCLPDNIPADNHIADEKDRHLRQFREMEQAACKKQHRRHDNACEQVPLFSCHSVFSFRCSIKRVTLFLSIDEKHRLPCGSRCPAFHYALTVTSGSICLISVFASARTASN